MYGKHHESMYEGSMIGAGAIKFAVWGYVIAKQKPSTKYGSVVILNPVLVGMLIGEEPKEIEKAIKFFCMPDPNSRTKDEEGRKLVRLGQYDYRVVNGAKYRKMRGDEDRRAYNRQAQRDYRARKAGLPLPGEANYENAEAAGVGHDVLNGIVTSHLPSQTEHQDPPDPIEPPISELNASYGEPDDWEGSCGQLEHSKGMDI